MKGWLWPGRGPAPVPTPGDGPEAVSCPGAGGTAPPLVPVVLHHPAGLLQRGPRKQQVSGVGHHEEVLGPALEGALVPAGLPDVDGGREGRWHLLWGVAMWDVLPVTPHPASPLGQLWSSPSLGGHEWGMGNPLAMEQSGDPRAHPADGAARGWGDPYHRCTPLTLQSVSGEPPPTRSG